MSKTYYVQEDDIRVTGTLFIVKTEDQDFSVDMGLVSAYSVEKELDFDTTKIEIVIGNTAVTVRLQCSEESISNLRQQLDIMFTERHYGRAK